MSAPNVNVCDIPEDVMKALNVFRFQRIQHNSALIIKVNREKQSLQIDEELSDLEIEDLQEVLPSHQPRFIIYTFRMTHDDGRVSYPLCFIFYTPRDAQMELQVMYAGTQRALAAAVGAPRMLEVRELEELNTEWLNEKMKK
ncbi:glia maturation factor [Epargyreus clarus]|uniref:glia maturation factor n=1 Tax=Epargyreus clarus TaxID=520877 RepID=UPI003C30EB32